MTHRIKPVKGGVYHATLEDGKIDVYVVVVSCNELNRLESSCKVIAVDPYDPVAACKMTAVTISGVGFEKEGKWYADAFLEFTLAQNCLVERVGQLSLSEMRALENANMKSYGWAPLDASPLR